MALSIGRLKLGDVPLIAGVLTDRDVTHLPSDVIDAVDIIELRVDMFESTDTAHVVEVFRTVRDALGKPIIATVRDVREGGVKVIDDRRRLYETCVPLCEAVDVEVRAGELLAHARGLVSAADTLLIGSYHHFSETPDEIFLDSIVTKAKDAGADIVKIAVTARTREDLVRLLLFTLRHRDKGMITMSMGDAGLPSRVVSPIFGSLVSYGYVSHPSAPGQLSVVELMRLFRTLKLR